MGDLRVERVLARYDTGRNVLHEVTFSLCAGQAILVYGHNGSGKSTLLRVLSGLLPLESGVISWRGAPVKDVLVNCPVHPWVGLMLQRNSIFPSLTVEENLDLATDRGHRSEKEGVLDELPTLKPLEHKRAGLLSSGERKLLGLAMALGTRASLLLLDEPVAGLSDLNTKAVLDMLSRRKAKGAAIIIVEHSIEALHNGLIDIRAEMLEGVFMLETDPLRRKEGS